ncbi:MAG TPA: C-GCAxxG-C-C family (seleno)protein [Armatimonadota bacterium]
MTDNSQTPEERAVQLYDRGLQCSEALLKTYNERLELGLGSTALRMASGFAHGYGGAGLSCGCLTSAIMVLGALYGRTKPDEPEERVQTLASEMERRFHDRFGTDYCADLTLGLRWGGEEQRRHCTQVVRESVRILEDILREAGLPAAGDRPPSPHGTAAH